MSELHSLNNVNALAIIEQKFKQKIRTKAATKAETEPPPGAEVRAATLITNSLTVDVIKGPSVLGRVYSIILSLKKLRVESSPYV